MQRKDTNTKEIPDYVPAFTKDGEQLKSGSNTCRVGPFAHSCSQSMYMVLYIELHLITIDTALIQHAQKPV